MVYSDLQKCQAKVVENSKNFQQMKENISQKLFSIFLKRDIFEKKYYDFKDLNLSFKQNFLNLFFSLSNFKNLIYYLNS